LYCWKVLIALLGKIVLTQLLMPVLLLLLVVAASLLAPQP
jgi:hypothetical protein